MKIIFLDIDGVITTANTRYRLPDQCCIEYLNRIIKATDAKIVVSSTWRMAGLESIRVTLQDWGIKGEIIDMTPDLSGRNRSSGIYIGVERGQEIAAWMEEFGNEPDSIVILDDDIDMGVFKHRLVQTSPIKGLQEEDIKRAIINLEKGIWGDNEHPELDGTLYEKGLV